jgi:hypothetical protein
MDENGHNGRRWTIFGKASLAATFFIWQGKPCRYNGRADFQSGFGDSRLDNGRKWTQWTTMDDFASQSSRCV